MSNVESSATSSKSSEQTGARRGFAKLSPEKLRAIASAGGRAAHASGKAHHFTSEEARVAGRKGGKAPHVSRGRYPTNEK